MGTMTEAKTPTAFVDSMSGADVRRWMMHFGYVSTRPNMPAIERLAADLRVHAATLHRQFHREEIPRQLHLSLQAIEAGSTPADIAARVGRADDIRSTTKKLTDAQVDEVRKRVEDDGESQSSVARDLNISRSLVSKILSGVRR